MKARCIMIECSNIFGRYVVKLNGKIVTETAYLEKSHFFHSESLRLRSNWRSMYAVVACKSHKTL